MRPSGGARSRRPAAAAGAAAPPIIAFELPPLDPAADDLAAELGAPSLPPRPAARRVRPLRRRSNIIGVAAAAVVAATARVRPRLRPPRPDLYSLARDHRGG
jgi:hypothetical protein